MNELEDIFSTDEFKALPWRKRAWLRFRIAFIQTISMM